MHARMHVCVCKRLGPSLRNKCSSHGWGLMPRSVPSSEASTESSATSDFEGEESSEAVELDWPVHYSTMLGPPNPPPRDAASLAAIQDEQLQLSERTMRSMEWFCNIVPRFFCWQSRRCFMEEIQGRPSRSISASLATWGRTQSELPANEVLERTAAHLDDATAGTLWADFAWLATLLRQQSERNDRAWILTTGNQFCPGKPLLQQKLWPSVVSRCSSASLKAWFRRLRTPFLIWPRLCGTRTTSWFCCHGLLRRSSCSSNNGSRSTSGTSFLLWREAPGRLHHCPARSQIVLPFLGAPTIPLRNEQLGHWACRQLGADIRTDRPGPISVDMWHTSTSESRTGSLIVLAVNMLTPRSCVPHVDVRVEGRLGCTPSEAASFALAVCRMEAKHWTLSKFSKTVLKGQASLEFFLQST